MSELDLSILERDGKKYILALGKEYVVENNETISDVLKQIQADLLSNCLSFQSIGRKRLEEYYSFDHV
jgi:hypothetical protein